MENAGVPREYANANAARNHIVRELLTRGDLNNAIELAAERMTIRLDWIVMAAVAAAGVFLALFLSRLARSGVFSNVVLHESSA